MSWKSTQLNVDGPSNTTKYPLRGCRKVKGPLIWDANMTFRCYFSHFVLLIQVTTAVPVITFLWFHTSHGSKSFHCLPTVPVTIAEIYFPWTCLKEKAHDENKASRPWAAEPHRTGLFTESLESQCAAARRTSIWSPWRPITRCCLMPIGQIQFLLRDELSSAQ